jgi:Cu/Ag efflux protein CusF
MALGLAGTVQAQTPATGSKNEQSSAPSKTTPSTAPNTVGDSGPATASKGQQTGAGSKAGSSFGANQIVGQIKTVNRSTKEIAIDQAGKQQSLKLSENATVFTNGRLGSFEDLKEGQQVRAAYEERGGQKTLRWIEVMPTGAGSSQQGIDTHGSDGAAPKPTGKQPPPPSSDTKPSSPDTTK